MGPNPFIGVIYHWIATGQLTRDVDAPPVRRAAPRATKLDRFTGIIGERLTTYPELSAVRLYEEVKAAGYSGGITQLRDAPAKWGCRPTRNRTAVHRLPIEAAADWPSERDEAYTMVRHSRSISPFRADLRSSSEVSP